MRCRHHIQSFKPKPLKPCNSLQIKIHYVGSMWDGKQILLTIPRLGIKTFHSIYVKRNLRRVLVSLVNSRKPQSQQGTHPEDHEKVRARTEPKLDPALPRGKGGALTFKSLALYPCLIISEGRTRLISPRYYQSPLAYDLES